MDADHTQISIISGQGEFRAVLSNALRLWAEAVTAPSTEQRTGILHYKQNVVDAFFAFAAKHPAAVSPVDVEAWRKHLEAGGLKPTTIYTRICFLSSFFQWAMRAPALKEHIKTNPVRLAMPKAPKAYQTGSVRAWTDDELQAIVEVVRKKAEGGDLVGKRDYALLLFYLVTGMRRQEVIGLCGGEVKLKRESIVITGKVKGGDYVGREVNDSTLKEALVDYLSAAGRMGEFKIGGPLWTRHDHAGSPGAALTSHAFVKNLKRYAREAGVGDVHLHQTRHSFARIVAEETGSMTETQDALGHRNVATTRVYVQRIAVKKDRYSAHVVRRLRNS